MHGMQHLKGSNRYIEKVKDFLICPSAFQLPPQTTIIFVVCSSRKTREI